MSARAFAIVIGALAVVGLLAFGLLKKGEGGIALGEPLPEASLPALDDPTAPAEVSLDDYEGRWVLVNVWASWCNPCRDEAPALERFWRKHGGDDFALVGIDTQDNTTTRSPSSTSSGSPTTSSTTAPATTPTRSAPPGSRSRC